MSANNETLYIRRLSLPFVLLSVCLVAQMIGVSLLASGETVSIALGVCGIASLLWCFLIMRKIDSVATENARNKERNSAAQMSTLLDEIAPLASGELNVKATIYPESQGALAKAFNFVIGELQQIIGSQQTVARALSETLSNSSTLVAHAESQAVEQSRHIRTASDLLKELGDSSSQLSVSVADIGALATAIKDKADDSSDSLGALMNGARSASRTVGLSKERVLSLQQHSGALIEGVSTLAETIRNTSLLAINAGLRCSSRQPVQHPKDSQPFIDQLSSELATLAEQLGKAVGEIHSLAKATQADSAELFDLTLGLEACLGDHLDDAELLDRYIADSRDVAQAIKVRGTKQVRYGADQIRVVDELGENMTSIKDISREVLGDIRGNASSLDIVKQQSMDLRHKLSDFNMPAYPRESGQKISSARRAANRAVVNER